MIVRICIQCKTNQSYKWFSGPLCRRCYRQQPNIREKELIVQRRYRNENKDKILSKKKEWRNNNKDYDKNRSSTDINFKLKRLLRNRLFKVVRGHIKTGSSVKDLGCSIEELKVYLESKFESWMNWDNYGPAINGIRTWQIDHIKPLSSFNLCDREELLRACHFSNLQPMESIKNLSKGAKYGNL